MIAAAMAFGLVISALLAAAGATAERGLRALRLPLRWSWIVSLTAATGLTGAAVRAAAYPDQAAVRSVTTPSSARPAPAQGESRSTEVSAPTEQVAQWGAWPVRASQWLSRLDLGLLIIWTLSSCAGLGMLITGALRLRAARRHWKAVVVAGRDVLVSPDVGPATAGILAPAIVIPGWALPLSPERLDMVVRHESEHAGSGDPLLLLSARLLVLLQPWNLPAWYCLHRLRVAVEIDCDARVLGADGDRATYASLLLDVGGHKSGLRTSTALAGLSIPLERRIEMITDARHHGSAWHGLGALAVASLLAAVACTGRHPVPAPAPLSVARADSAHLFLPSGTLLRAIARRYEPGAFLSGDRPAQIVALVFDDRDSVVEHAVYERHAVSGDFIDSMLTRFPQFARNAQDQHRALNTAGIADVGSEALSTDATEVERPNPGSIWVVWASYRACWSSTYHRPCTSKPSPIS